MNANAAKTITFSCPTRTGMTWQPTAFSAPVPRRDWLAQGTAGAVVANVRAARKAGWTVEVIGEWPGASMLRAAAA